MNKLIAIVTAAALVYWVNGARSHESPFLDSSEFVEPDTNPDPGRPVIDLDSGENIEGDLDRVALNNVLHERGNR